MATTPNGRNFLLLPWYIGLGIIAVVDALIGYLFYSVKEAPGFAQFLVLVGVPGVYLVLMYLTLNTER
jgi:hypothetical protein